MKLTTSRQRDGVSEGIALGLLMCGLNELRYEKVAIDLSFYGAWRDWSHTSSFRRVSTDLRHGSDPIGIITHAGRRSQVINYFWDVSGAFPAICVRSQWSHETFPPEEIAKSVDGGLSADAWKQLADALLRGLTRH